MTDEELKSTEKMVNSLIRNNNALKENREASMEEAKAMGAIALFGEKYGDKVRVVKFGDSIELCGGTHTHATGNIGIFKIVSEGAVAAGIRRIEAVTGEAAEKLIYEMQDTLKSAKGLFNNPPDLSGSIKKILEENAAYKKELEAFMLEKAGNTAKNIVATAKTINGIRIAKFSSSEDPAIVKEIASILHKEEKGLAFAAAFENAGKPQLVLMYTNDLVAKGKNAGNDIRQAAKLILGGGGGQPWIATAGGKDVSGLAASMEVLVDNATK